MPKFIFQLTGTNANGPSLIYFNVRGTSHKFFWNEKYRKHIFENRELDCEEFNKLAFEFATADPMENACFAVGRCVEVEIQLNANISSPEPDLTLSERREFLKTIAELEEKIKSRKGGRPRKHPLPTVSQP